MTGPPFVLAVGADNAGAELKNFLAGALRSNPGVTEVIDFGVADSTDQTAYPDIGFEVAAAVADGRAQRGLLVCGTGIGMAISANKVPGIRATVAHDSFSVERSVLSNDCQILTLGARVIGPELALRLVKEWVTYEFDDSSPSSANVARITAIEASMKAAATRQ
jgi:ribose 5-phosphate isomerase B